MPDGVRYLAGSEDLQPPGQWVWALDFSEHWKSILSRLPAQLALALGLLSLFANLAGREIAVSVGARVRWYC